MMDFPLACTSSTTQCLVPVCAKERFVNLKLDDGCCVSLPPGVIAARCAKCLAGQLAINGTIAVPWVSWTRGNGGSSNQFSRDSSPTLSDADDHHGVYTKRGDALARFWSTARYDPRQNHPQGMWLVPNSHRPLQQGRPTVPSCNFRSAGNQSSSSSSDFKRDSWGFNRSCGS